MSSLVITALKIRLFSSRYTAKQSISLLEAASRFSLVRPIAVLSSAYLETELEPRMVCSHG